LQGDETFAAVDFKELESKLKVGDHVIVDFGAVCMRVIGFEDEVDFLVSKHLEGLPMKHTVREMKQPDRQSISCFQETQGLTRHTNRFRAITDLKHEENTISP